MGDGQVASSTVPEPESERGAMKLPVQIAFHNMPHHADIASAIRAQAEWLENYSDRIMSCRVVVDRPHLHHKDGNLYQIRIDLKVPGRELAVKRGQGQQTDSQDLNLMIRDAFDEARRQLEDHARRRRGEIKAHESLPHARVVRVFPEPGYGFLETSDGREVYFHRNSVVEARFEDLEVGTEVRFVEELGDKGPQASTVTRVGRHSHL
jgi:cold shock CspA family protein